MSSFNHHPFVSRGSVPLALFLLFSAFYLLTMSGHMYVSDEETMYLVTRQIALRGEVAIDAEPGSPVAALRGGVGKRNYSPYGILPSLLAMPFFGVGTLAAPPDSAAFDYSTRLAVAALNGFVTAATAGLLAGWALRLGARRGSAIALALLYGLCTFAWPYARTFFSEPLVACLLLAAVERAEASRHTQKIALPLFLSGLAAGLIVATRIAGAIALPFVALYALWPQLDTGALPVASLRRLINRRVLLTCYWSTFRRAAIWGLGLAPGLLLVGGYNILRSGTPFASGYDDEAKSFITPLMVGLYGLLLSPGKSVFLFAPPILLALPGALRLWPRRPGIVLLASGLFALHVWFYARWIAWSGGAWGPRFLLPTIPLLMLLAGAAFDDGLAGRQIEAAGRTRWRDHTTRAAVVLLGMAGFVGSLGGVLVNFDIYLNMPVTEERRVYEPLGTPLIAHWQILADRVGRYTFPAPHCALGAGFFRPEQLDRLFPRRTGVTGEIRCRLDNPTLLTLTLNDGRPAELPDSALTFYLEDNYIGQRPAPQARTYILLLPAGNPTLRLTSHTWNPSRTGFSNRDDELGIVITAAQIWSVAGEPVPLIDLAIAPLPEPPGARFAWYYERFNQHLVDHWAWYLTRSELAGRGAGAVAVIICVVAVGLAGAGGVLLVKRET